MHNFAIKRGIWGLMAAGLCLLTLAPSMAAIPKGYGLGPEPDSAARMDPIPKGYGFRPSTEETPVTERFLRPEVCPEIQPLPQLEEEAPVAGPAETTDTVLVSATEQQLKERAASQLRGRGLTKEQNEVLSLRLVSETTLLVLLEEGELTTADLIYLALPNSRAALLDRYNAWAADHPADAPAEVVRQVNLDRDVSFYENIQIVTDPDSLTVLVNKNHALPSDYVPQLETLGSGYGSGSLRPEAAQAFRAMADAARKDGVSLRGVSAYRSFQTQRSVYNRYLYYNSQAVVDTFSARPGSSEHQTGLALDINTANVQAHFETTPAYDWLQKHCAEYGFMLRYLQGKEDITGYRFEPWHYRYVGTEIAKTCMERGITYEEYLALQSN